MNYQSLLNSIFIVILLLISTLVAPILVSTNRTKGYKVLIAIDQLWAVIIFNREDITVSSLLWYNYIILDNKKYRKYIKIVDFLAYILAKQKNHCEVSYQHETKEFKDYIKIYDYKEI